MTRDYPLGRVPKMVLRECPFCHRPFEAELLSKKPVDSSEVAKIGNFPPGLTGGMRATGPGRNLLILGLTDDRRKAVAMHPEAFITYQLNYRCKHCGKEWTKISVEEKQIPREYLEDDREKTDYDAHVEEEEAREEEYARR